MVGSVDGVAIFVGYKREVDVDVVDVSRVVRGQVRTITPAPTVRHDALLVRQLIFPSSSGARRRALSVSSADILPCATSCGRIGVTAVLFWDVPIANLGTRQNVGRSESRFVSPTSPLRSARWA